MELATLRPERCVHRPAPGSTAGVRRTVLGAPPIHPIGGISARATVTAIGLTPRSANRPARVGRTQDHEQSRAPSCRNPDRNSPNRSGRARTTLVRVLTEDELLRFRAGESDAVRAVYREYGRLVYAVCRNQLGSPQLAEEAAQQTFLKAWRVGGDGRTGPGPRAVAGHHRPPDGDRRLSAGTPGEDVGDRRRVRSRTRRWCSNRWPSSGRTTSGRYGRPWTNCPRTSGSSSSCSTSRGSPRPRSPSGSICRSAPSSHARTGPTRSSPAASGTCGKVRLTS